MDVSYILLAILAASCATFATRVLPFLIFDKKQNLSKMLELFEKNMPLMIMVVLVFYALKDTVFREYPYGMSEIAGILSAFILHVSFKNVLLSIMGATAVYMLFVQMVFA
ncbi:MAG: AzlD domain-containing protein [Campylobacteraceae bacterium]|jgi:branched-subunit amino acid transport protein AzlD|nr:AzlD domain-containing protein [Campylobacteraceae bacterium]